MIAHFVKRGWIVGGLLLSGVWTASCAPPVTRTRVKSTTVGNVRMSERWLPERGVQSIALRRDERGLLLHVQAIRVCRVWEAEKRFHRTTWESKPNAGMIVGELVMIATGIGATTAAWASTQDRCGSGDVLSSCDDFAHGVALLGAGLALAGTTALVVDLISADSGEETTASLGRAIPPHDAACKEASLVGQKVRLVGPNVTLSSVFDQKGVARFDVPKQIWAPAGSALDLDVVIAGHIVGRVVMTKEAACDDC